MTNIVLKWINVRLAEDITRLVPSFSVSVSGSWIKNSTVVFGHFTDTSLDSPPVVPWRFQMKMQLSTNTLCSKFNPRIHILFYFLSENHNKMWPRNLKVLVKNCYKKQAKIYQKSLEAFYLLLFVLWLKIQQRQGQFSYLQVKEK